MYNGCNVPRGAESDQYPQDRTQRVKKVGLSWLFACWMPNRCCSPRLNSDSDPVPEHKYEQEKGHDSRLNPESSESNTKSGERLHRCRINIRRKIQPRADRTSKPIPGRRGIIRGSYGQVILHPSRYRHREDHTRQQETPGNFSKAHVMFESPPSLDTNRLAPRAPSNPC